MPDFPNIIIYAIPFFILAMLLELYVTTKQHIKTYETKDAFYIELRTKQSDDFGKAMSRGDFGSLD
jgi:hypothetical protein